VQTACGCTLADGSSTLGSDNADAAAVLIVLHGALNKGEEREIVALTDAAAGMKAVADLPDKDIARDNALAAKSLHAAALTIGIAAVAAGTLTFFMCHDVNSNSLQPRTTLPRSRNLIR
jgi:uncharacterized protein YfiM (DUF2279 family)